MTKRAGPKRALDVALSGIGLVTLSPLMAFIAFLIKLDSAGPVLFRQERVGQYGHTFQIHKFRTMRVGTGGALVSTSTDPRITRVGAVLRRTKLDELPQLMDVLMGHMSLVGPRPEVPRYVEAWPCADRALILSVRPGITDPASIAMRREAERLEQVRAPEEYYINVLMPEKCAMYVAYVNERSLSGDFLLIMRTIWALLRERKTPDCR